MASYSVNPAAVAHAERLIDARQYVLDSEWGSVQPRAADENDRSVAETLDIWDRTLAKDKGDHAEEYQGA